MRRDGDWVAELTALVDLAARRPAPRLVCRREHPHHGAQLSLFDTVAGFRHLCVLTESAAPSNLKRINNDGGTAAVSGSSC
jgi:hypothetical protein